MSLSFIFAIDLSSLKILIFGNVFRKPTFQSKVIVHKMRYMYIKFFQTECMLYVRLAVVCCIHIILIRVLICMECMKRKLCNTVSEQ